MVTVGVHRVFRCLVVVLWAITLGSQPPPFVASPYLQYDGRMLVLWHAPDDGAKWRLEYAPSGGQVREAGMSSQLAAIRKLAPYRIHQAVLSELPAGAGFEYRVHRDGRQVFSAQGRGWKAPGSATRFGVVGDTGSGTSGERAVVYQMHLANLDYFVITGDIVYEYGRASEYWEKYYPVYNAATASLETGAPLVRSVVSLAAPGNHDTSEAFNLGSRTDAFAYFLFWALPMNGFTFSPPPVRGPVADYKAFLEATGGKFPRTANYSFDAGDVHWIIIDSNPYMIWNDQRLRDWLVKDMQAARARWKFVAFHHPPFHSSAKHRDQLQMRTLAPLFESGGIDMVWAGHVHNYQRSYPLRGEAVDRQFDGLKKTKADGVIYMVSGAGGAGLHNDGRDGRPDRWKPFTARYFGSVHSFTMVEASAEKVEIRQIDANGKEQDHFILTH